MSEKEKFLYQEGKNVFEVYLTGRVARKKRGRREIVLHEIASVDTEADFSAWIKRDQLFTVENLNDTE